MMTRLQERSLRRLFQIGGRLTLPGRDAPLHIGVDLAKPGADKNIVFAVVEQGGLRVIQYGNWAARDLYPDIAEVIDQLTPSRSESLLALEEVAHG